MDFNRKDNDNQPERKVVAVTIVHEEDEVEITDTLEPTFQSLQEWVFHLCDSEKPSKRIESYNFGITQSGDDFVMSLVGANDYQINENHTISQRDFEPVNMFLLLPDKDYKELDFDQVITKVKSQLAEILTTEKFKTSYLAQAKMIKVAGEQIWSR